MRVRFPSSPRSGTMASISQSADQPRTVSAFRINSMVAGERDEASMFEKTGAIKCFAITLLAVGVALAQAPSTLDIYTIDVEGGNATLFVAPSGESLLIDTGNAGNQASRDAARILEATQAAGLKQIDHLIVTHWHGDHLGGLPELAPKIPIKEFIDHGPNVQPGELADTFLAKPYPQILGNAKHTVAKPCDKISI